MRCRDKIRVRVRRPDRQLVWHCPEHHHLETWPPALNWADAWSEIDYHLAICHREGSAL